MEQTLAIIKPDAFDHSSEIEQRIKEEGFRIVAVGCSTLHSFRVRQVGIVAGQDGYAVSGGMR